MMYFKGCPRCSGDLVDQDDVFGPYTLCINCGYVLYPKDEESGRYLAESSGPANVADLPPARIAVGSRG